MNLIQFPYVEFIERMGKWVKSSSCQWLVVSQQRESTVLLGSSEPFYEFLLQTYSSVYCSSLRFTCFPPFWFVNISYLEPF